MPWTVQVSDDADTTGEKTATAVWTEKTGSPPAVFTYTGRGKATQAGVNAFAAAAIAARNAWQTANTANATASNAVLTRINAVDPQAA